MEIILVICVGIAILMAYELTTGNISGFNDQKALSTVLINQNIKKAMIAKRLSNNDQEICKIHEDLCNLLNQIQGLKNEDKHEINEIVIAHRDKLNKLESKMRVIGIYDQVYQELEESEINKKSADDPKYFYVNGQKLDDDGYCQWMTQFSFEMAKELESMIYDKLVPFQETYKNHPHAAKEVSLYCVAYTFSCFLFASKIILTIPKETIENLKRHFISLAMQAKYPHSDILIWDSEYFDILDSHTISYFYGVNKFWHENIKNQNPIGVGETLINDILVACGLPQSYLSHETRIENYYLIHSCITAAIENLEPSNLKYV